MKRIILVEDDMDFAEILKEELEDDNQVKVVAMLHSEQEARDYFAINGLAGIDCALVDLVLPGIPGARSANSMVGLNIVHSLRQELDFSGLIIVLTNSRLLEDGERALSAGCDGYLCKHAQMSEIPSMVLELKLALRGSVVLVSREMRHVFIRDELSAKEARLMELINGGATWAEVATQLGYKTSKAAATIGYRIFDKLLTPAENAQLSEDKEVKRKRALEKWRARYQFATVR
ncbi:MAG: response regulator [Candidatus Obscuribacterales bacterium]|nr:response regulator [Candidatus Obscuribacterales bacterium]